jgi:septal ring factor EnvC (AmiA/AmiB activator)
MTSSLFEISMVAVLAALLGILVFCMVLLYRTLADLNLQLREIRGELSPAFQDIRSFWRNMAEASETLKDGAKNVENLAETIGRIGDDLEEGRQAVKDMTGPGLSLLKIIRQIFKKRES